MRVIYKIARLELSILFYSPVAWLLLIGFVFMTAMTFTGTLENMANSQELANRTLSGISRYLFYASFSGSLWSKIPEWFYVIMPLLTMGLISQEFSRGSMKLLFSAPINAWHIVLGKFLGVMLYGLLMMAILAIYALLAASIVPSFEWSAVLCGFLGLYLLFGLYTAIGLFMSSLTIYPIIAAIGMFALLTVLSMVSNVWQEYNFVRDITYWLSLGGRVNTFIRGMICSEDVFYFLFMTGMFVGFAGLKLQGHRESSSFAIKISRYAVVFAIAVFLGYLSSRPVLKKYYDGTYVKGNTLTKASQDIVARLDGKLTITTYVNLFGDMPLLTPKGINHDLSRYEQYIRFKPDTKMKYVFYYHVDTTSISFKEQYPDKTLEEAARDKAKLRKTRISKYLSPEEIDAKIDLSDEGYRFVTLLERANGKKTWLRTYDRLPQYPEEREISAAMKRIAMKLPRVGFLSDYGARSITGNRNRDYSYSVSEKSNPNAMINQGFDVVDISLKRSKKELDSLDVLVIAEPLQAFTEDEINCLHRYIDSGHNLILAGKPNTYGHLTPLMEYLGLQFEAGILVQKKTDEYPWNLLLCHATKESRNISGLWDVLYTNTSAEMRPGNLLMPGALAIEQTADKGYELIPLLTSRDTASWNELGTTDFINETPILNPTKGERAGSKTTMMALQREQAGHQQRIIVMGDAECISMGELTNRRRGINAINNQLVMAMFNWLSYEELPIITTRSGPIDNKLELGINAAAKLKIALQWVLPSLLLLLGLVLLIRRKGK